jgi:AraC family transcriptional regulator, transcriptional activator of pobA
MDPTFPLREQNWTYMLLVTVIAWAFIIVSLCQTTWGKYCSTPTNFQSISISQPGYWDNQWIQNPGFAAEFFPGNTTFDDIGITCDSFVLRLVPMATITVHLRDSSKSIDYDKLAAENVFVNFNFSGIQSYTTQSGLGTFYLYKGIDSDGEHDILIICSSANISFLVFVYLYFANMPITTLEEFYRDTAALIPEGINREIGHFNVFNIADVIANSRKKGPMPYNRRAYYKISIIRGRNRAEYADKVIHIAKNALLFATPKIPYHYLPQDENQSGFFCIFTDEFLIRNKSGVILEDLPIFQPGGYPIFELTDTATKEIIEIFRKMSQELSSDYAFKYDLIRNYLLELIHYGQKLQPATALYPTHTASERVSSLFIELLERQFPIESPRQKLSLRTAKDYAERLSIHVNHLNKVLKENLGKTTTDIISSRIVQEAKILLKQTDWNISEIAYSLGFEELAHFSNFFKKQTRLSPQLFRS